MPKIELGKRADVLIVELGKQRVKLIKATKAKCLWCPFDWPQCPSKNHCLALDIRELSHRRRTDSGTVIWYGNWSARTRPPHLFILAKIANAFLPNYRRCSIKNERVKQPISALLGDSWVHRARSHATPYVLQCAKSQIMRTTDEWRGRSQLIALRPRIRRCSICESSVFWCPL